MNLNGRFPHPSPESPDRGHHYEHWRTTAVQVLTPAVRCVSVTVWVGASGLSTKVDPVVAVEAAMVEIWRCETVELGSPPTAPHPHDLTPLGWSYHATVTRYTPVIAGWGEPFPGFPRAPPGFLRAPDVLVEEILLQRTVACPWPAEEDNERLASVLEQLRAEALAPVTDD